MNQRLVKLPRVENIVDLGNTRLGQRSTPFCQAFVYRLNEPDLMISGRYDTVVQHLEDNYHNAIYHILLYKVIKNERQRVSIWGSTAKHLEIAHNNNRFHVFNIN